MNTCKTCKWWTRTPPSDPYHDEKRLYFEQWNDHVPDYQFGRDYIDAHGVAPHGDCNNLEFVYAPIPDSLNGLSYHDYDGYAASLKTGEEFGCIHHEPTEQ